MCGICGVYSKTLGTSEKEIFRNLLAINVYRGEDSTGVFKISKNENNSAYSTKAALPSPYFTYSDQGAKFIKEDRGGGTFCLVGHARAATVGKVVAKNAHPFSFSHIVGVHNGTIRGTFPYSDKYDTDSEALYAWINEEFAKNDDHVEALKKVLTELQENDPAYVLIFYDKKQKTLNFIRNDKRPLSLTYIYSKGTLLWSSDQKHLEAVVKFKGTVTPTGWEVAATDPYFTIKPGHLFQLPMDKHPRDGVTITDLDLPPVKKKAQVYSGYYGGAAWIQGSDGQYRTVQEEARRQRNMMMMGEYDENDWAEYIEDSYKDDLKKFDASLDKSKGSSKKEPTLPFDPDPPKDQASYQGFREHFDGEDLKKLSWMKKDAPPGIKRAKNDNKTKGPAQTPPKPFSKGDELVVFGGQPLSAAERAFKLSRGCMCCGERVDPTDEKEVSRVKWWNRNAFACGTCYDTSDGDWVRMTIEEEWDKLKVN